MRRTTNPGFLATYLQQADMESNGKSVDRWAQTRDRLGRGVGSAGTTEEAFYQLIHQGTELIPSDFLAPARSHYPLGRHHEVLLANFVAQTEALMRGRTFAETRAGLEDADKAPPGGLDLLAAAKTFAGNRPTTSIVFPLLTPRVLGMVVALYEHKIFVQGVVWNVNSFDQMGRGARQELGALLDDSPDSASSGKSGNTSDHDSSTLGLLSY